MTLPSQQTTTSSTSNTAYAGDSDIFKKPDIAALNSNYSEGEGIDQDVFAEQRSNVLLVAGDHYSRKQSRFYKRIRESRELSQEQKLRLTKNHIRKICQVYSNNIMSMEPGVGFEPKDENSMHDQKVSELHHSVWQDAIKRYDLQDKMDDWCDSFIQIGEVSVKLFWDETLGDVAGYEPTVDEETQEPILNEFGQMVPDETKPVFSGEFVFEEIYGFNLLRPPECKNMKKAEWLGIRKMANKGDLLRRIKDPDKKKFIRSDADETYVVFDAAKGGYKKSVNQTMVREYYYRPSPQFPKGYFYITTKEGILDEGELPGGLFPIVFMPFDKIQTTPRGRSPIKTMRPYQAEINRSASKMAEHQITLGDDKLLIQNGTKVSAGASLPGIRSINFTGQSPTILQGRAGDQYLAYMNSQISELYQVMSVPEDSEEKQTGAIEPYSLLFRSARQKKKFQRYIKRFEKFLLEIVKLYLQLAKLHLPDDAVVWAVGKNEQVNIPEFRQYPDTCFEVNILPQADDIETKFGKQLVMNHVMQYVGPQLQKDDIGKLLRNMPYANFDESFDDLTIDYDSAQNDMLALDRGEQPPVNQYDNHIYCIKRLTSRTRKADFQFLPPNVKQNYFGKINLHQQFEAQNKLALQRAEQGFIPTGGYMVTCEIYVTDPSDPTGQKTRRARVPYEAMNWLIKQLEVQGSGLQQLENMAGGAQAQIADKITQMGGPQAGMPGQMAPPMPQPQRMPMPMQGAR